MNFPFVFIKNTKHKNTKKIRGESKIPTRLLIYVETFSHEKLRFLWA